MEKLKSNHRGTEGTEGVIVLITQGSTCRIELMCPFANVNNSIYYYKEQ